MSENTDPVVIDDDLTFGEWIESLQDAEAEQHGDAGEPRQLGIEMNHGLD